jgi:hypothetical protein
MISIRIYDGWEHWHIHVEHSGQHLQERLRYAIDTQPQVSIETPEDPTGRCWIVTHNGHHWRGEDVVDFGIYDVRFLLRRDSEASKSPAKEHTKTRSQAKEKSAEKAAATPTTPAISIDVLNLTETPPAKDPPITVTLPPAATSTPPKLKAVIDPKIVASGFYLSNHPQSKFQLHDP